MRIYPICIVPFPLIPFFSMVLVRLYGNSWKWQRLRRCFAEWNNRMDQFGEMRKMKKVIHEEKSRSGAAGKRRYDTHILLNQARTISSAGNKMCWMVLTEDVLKEHRMHTNNDS